MKDDKRVYNNMRKVKFSYSQDRFNIRLEQELRGYVSDDVIHSLARNWNEMDKVYEEIHRVKESLIDSVITNKYNKVYRI